jgi:hypothetical protein
LSREESAPNPYFVAYIQIKRQNELASYLRRGRQRAQTPTETLEGRWVALMRQWGGAWGKGNWDFDHRERDDVEAELELRGIELPGHLVRDVHTSLGVVEIKDFVKI